MTDSHGDQSPASSLQAKVEPLSLEVKAKLALVAVVLLGGLAVIDVFGGVVSSGVASPGRA